MSICSHGALAGVWLRECAFARRPFEVLLLLASVLHSVLMCATECSALHWCACKGCHQFCHESPITDDMAFPNGDLPASLRFFLFCSSLKGDCLSMWDQRTLCSASSWSAAEASDFLSLSKYESDVSVDKSALDMVFPLPPILVSRLLYNLL